MVRKKRKIGARVFLFIFLLSFSSFCFGQAEDSLYLRVGTLLKGDGQILKDVVVEIRNGKILYVGKELLLKKGMNIIEFKDSIATPGFIAANACLKATEKTKEVDLLLRRGRQFSPKRVPALNEEESESTPEINLLHAIDPKAEDFEKAWRSGVTCVYLAPGNLNVFNGTGTVLKTAGKSPQEMLVRNEVHLKVTFGTEPATGASRGLQFDLRRRRPQNRMGITFIFRNQLTDVLNKNDVPDSELNLREIMFRRVLKKEIPLRIRARSYMDIMAALRMMEEFGYRWILEDGADAHKYLDDLKKNRIPVVYGPVYKPKGRTDFNSEEDSYLPQTPLLLAKKGILFAFQNNEQSPINSFRDEAIFAVQIGLSREAALKALTFDAARILGVEDRLGTIEKGKDADLLIFKGDPFEPASLLEKVIINGKMFDPNK